jgi:hypothetical protein
MGRNSQGGAAISIIELIVRSESETAARTKRYVLSGVIGLVAGMFFMSVAWLILSGASQLMHYVI